jgi:hypothetical protein
LLIENPGQTTEAHGPVATCNQWLCLVLPMLSAIDVSQALLARSGLVEALAEYGGLQGKIRRRLAQFDILQNQSFQIRHVC